MKKLLLALTAFFLCSIGASAQGVRFDSQVTQQGTVATSSNVVVLPVSPKIAFCGAPASGVPCTNLATTYTDATLGTPCPTNTQIVLSSTSACVATPDLQNNWGVWVSPGQYTYTITIGAASFGPFFVTAGGSTAGSGLAVSTAGVPNTSQTALNFQTSTTNAVGLTVTPSNPSGGNEQIEVAGTYTGTLAPSTLAVGGNTIIKGPDPWRDFTYYMRDPSGNQVNCSTSNTTDPQATGTITSGSHTLTVSTAGTYKTGCGVNVIGAGPTATIGMGSTVTGSTTRVGTLVTFTITSGTSYLAPGIGSGTGFAGPVTVTNCSDTNFNTTTTGWLLNFGTPVTSLTYNTSGSGGTTATGCTANFLAGWAHGTTGSTTWDYYVAPIDANGGVGTAVGPITITNGAATLTPYNYNWIGWQVTPGAREFAIWRDNAGNGVYACINLAYYAGFSDWGTALHNGCPAYVPSTPPVSPTAQSLDTIIDSGGGTTTLTLHDAASNTATTQPVYEDVSMFLADAINDVQTDQINGGKTAGSYGVYVPYGLWPFNADMPTDTINAYNSGGVQIHMAGTPLMQSWPWMVSQNYSIIGEGKSGGSVSSQYFPTTLISRGPRMPAGFIIHGNTIDIENFSLLNMQGNAMQLSQDPSSNASTAGVNVNNVALNEQSGAGVGVPLLIDGNTIFANFSNMNFIPNSTCGTTFPASILFTTTKYASNGHADINFRNIFTEYHHIVIDSPAGQNNGQGTSFAQTGFWWSENHGTCATGGTITLDTGVSGGAVGAPTSSARLAGGLIENMQNADSSNKYLMSVLGNQTLSAIVSLHNSDQFRMETNCLNGSTSCAAGVASYQVSSDTGQLPGGSIHPFIGPIYSQAYQINYPTLFGENYGQTGPYWANIIASPHSLAVTGTGSGSLSAGTYCFVIEGMDSQGTPGHTMPSPEVCSTVGASSSISLQWATISIDAPNYRIYYGTSSGTENNYFTQVTQNSLNQTYTFSTTAGSSSGAAHFNVQPTAYSSWLNDITNGISCFLCVASGHGQQLGVGEPSPPSGDELAVKGGVLEAEAGFKTTSSTVGTTESFTEAGVASGVSATNVMGASSANHWPYFNPNNAGTRYACGSTGTFTSGHQLVANQNGTVCDVVDGGVPGSGGSVTSVNMENITTASQNLATCATATPGTTPDTTCTLANSPPHKFFGNNTGSSAAPDYFAIGEADLPAATVFTDQNATFGAHTYDFSGATAILTKVTAGYAPTTAGQFGINSTTHLPVFGFNGASTITIPVTNSGTTHQWLATYTQTTGAFTSTQPAFSDISGTAGVAQGGTNQTSYTKGDLLCASGATTLTKLAVDTNGKVATANSAATCGVDWETPASGITLQSNSVNNTSQSTLNFTDTSGGSGISFTNPSGGVESATLANAVGAGNSAVTATFTGFQQGDILCAVGGPTFVNCAPGVVANDQTGTSYTVLGGDGGTSDRGKFITFTNAGAMAVTLPQAGSAGFGGNFFFSVKNYGSGILTITPTTSTINGAATLVVNPNAQANIFTAQDGVDYEATTSSDGGVSSVTGCATTGGISYENGTTNTLTCGANMTYTSGSGIDTLTLGTIPAGFIAMKDSGITDISSSTAISFWAGGVRVADVSGQFGGNDYLAFDGATSGGTGIGVAAVAGNGCVVQLPKSSPTDTGEFLSIASASAGFCQSNWGATGNSSKTGQTGDLGAQTLLTPGADGLYQITLNVTCETSVSTATVLATLAYNDISNTSQTLATSAAACTTLGAASTVSLVTAINAKAGTAITYTTTTANTPHYTVRAAAIRMF